MYVEDSFSKSVFVPCARYGTYTKVLVGKIAVGEITVGEILGCIHWIDRDNGVFKIVDSVRVAGLWGRCRFNESHFGPKKFSDNISL
jgi:hypothetical protein